MENVILENRPLCGHGKNDIKFDEKNCNLLEIYFLLRLQTMLQSDKHLISLHK